MTKRTLGIAASVLILAALALIVWGLATDRPIVWGLGPDRRSDLNDHGACHALGRQRAGITSPKGPHSTPLRRSLSFKL
jgi:hypothetical protein